MNKVFLLSAFVGLALLIAAGAVYAQGPGSVSDGLVLWLKADTGVTSDGSGNVSQWTDQSTAGNNFTQSDLAKQPIITTNVIAGNPALRFSTGGEIRLLTHSGLIVSGNDATAFVIVQADPGNGWADWWNFGANGQPNHFAPGYGIWDDFGSIERPQVATSLAGDTPYIYQIGVRTGAKDNYLNGALQTTTNINNAWDTTQALGAYVPDLGGFRGYIAEVVIYNRTLSGTEATQVGQYLAQKYGIDAYSFSATISGVVEAAGTPVDGAAVTLYNSAGSVIGSAVTANGGQYSIPDLTENSDLTIVASYTGYVSKSQKLDIVKPTTSYAVDFDLVSASGLHGPANVDDGLVLWLKADAGVVADENGYVSQWVDQSAAGNDFWQATAIKQPVLKLDTIGGNPSVRFAGDEGTDVLVLYHAGPIVSGNEATAFVIVQADSSNGWADWWNFGMTSAGNHFCPGNGIWDDFGSVQRPQVVGPSLLGDTPYIYQIDVREGAKDSYLNSALQTTSSITNAWESVQALGAHMADYGRFQGNIAEVVIYNRTLSKAEATQVGQYLAQKYEIEAYSFSATISGVVRAAGTPVDDATVTLFTSAGGVIGSAVTADGGHYSMSGLTESPDLTIVASYTGYVSKSQKLDIVSPTISYTVDFDLVSASGLHGPDNIDDGLVLWLKADSGVITDQFGYVSQWVDQSSAGNDFWQTAAIEQPLLEQNTFGTNPSVRFSTVGEMLSLEHAGPIVSGNEATAFVVVKADSENSWADCWNFGANGQPNHFAPGYGIWDDFGSLERPQVVGAGLLANTPYIYEIDVRTGAKDSYLNDALQTTSNINNAWEPAQTLGTHVTGLGGFLGNIAEVVIYNRTLSQSETLKVGRYLAQKYEIDAYSFSATISGVVEAAGTPVDGAAVTLYNSTGSVIGSAVTADGGQYSISGLTESSDLTIVASYTGYVSKSQKLDIVKPTTSYAVDFDLVSASGLHGPANVDGGLVLWLKTDVGVVADVNGRISQWVDQSPAGNDFWQITLAEQPILQQNSIGGNASVRFSTAGEVLLLEHAGPIVSGEEATAFAIIKADSDNGWAELWKFGPNPLGNHFAPGNGIWDDFGSQQRPMVIGAEVLGDTPYIYQIEVRPGEKDALLNGALKTTTAITSGWGATQKLGFGTGGFGGFRGNIAEVIIYGRLLNHSEQELVGGYLSQKYGVSYTLPPLPSLMGASGASLKHAIMTTAASKYIWKLWGSVISAETDSFVIDDGSGVQVQVIAAGHGRTAGDYVTVEGTLDVSGTPPVLTSSADKVIPID